MGGVNCRHNFHPYIPGAPRAYSEKQLKEMDAKDVEYNGEMLTQYEASQKQREIERGIRAAKRTAAALEAAGQDASQYRTAIKELRDRYADFSQQTGLKPQQARTQIANPTT